MAVSHIKVDPQGDFTGTVTIFDSGGATATINATDMVRPSDWNSVHNQFITLSGNTVGASTVSGSNIIFQGGANITLSGNGDTIVFQGGAAAAGIAAVQAGTQTATSGTIVFDNLNNVTFGMTDGTITASIPQFVQQVDAGGGGIGAAVISFGNANDVSFAIQGGSVVGSIRSDYLTTQTVQTQASGNIARTGFTTTTVAGSVVAGTHDTAGLLLAVPAFLTTQSVQTQASGNIARTGFTTTTVAGSVVAGTHDTAGLKLAVPAYLTTAALSGDTTKYAGLGFTSTTTAGTDVKGTHSTNGLSMAFPAWLTTAALSGDTSKYAGTGFTSTTTAGTEIEATLNTAGLSMAVPAFLTAAGGGGTALTMYATSNTTQSSSGTMAMSSMIFAGAGIASVGITNGSVLISVPAGGGAGDGYNIIQAGSVGTTGTTWSSLSATVFMDGYGALTVSQNNSNRLGLSVPATSSLVGASGLSISTNGSTISIYDAPRSSRVLPDVNISALAALGNGSFSIRYVDIFDNITATRVDMPFLWQQGTTAAANTVAIAMTVLMGIYTRNVSTLNSVSTATTQTTYTYASNSAGATGITGSAVRPISIPINIKIQPGAYYMGFGISTSYSSIGTATTTAAQTISAMGVPAYSSAVGWVGDFSQATATSVGMLSGHGIYSAAVNSVVPAISLSAINQSGSYHHRAQIALVFRN